MEGKGADLGLRDEASGNDLYIWKIHHFLIGKSSLNKWGFNMIFMGCKTTILMVI